MSLSIIGLSGIELDLIDSQEQIKKLREEESIRNFIKTSYPGKVI